MNELLQTLPELLKGVFQGLRFIIPEIILTATFVIVVLVGLFIPGKRNNIIFWLGIGGMMASVLSMFLLPGYRSQEVMLFGNTLAADRVGVVFKVIFFAVTVLFALFVKLNPSFGNHKKGTGDLYMLLPGVLLGLNLMSMASSLLMIYISIEMISISSYLMVGYMSGDSKQTEASMKYVLFGSACSAIMLYGMSLLYGYTGTLNIYDREFMINLSQMPAAVTIVAIGLVLVGIGFKLSFVPVHFWSPDVYEGAPVPVTAFLSTGPKIAGFAILIRFMTAFTSFENNLRATPIFDFTAVLSAVAIASMIVGNFVAVWQTNIKRLLAYSSIGHTGFILVAVISGRHSGLKVLLFYLLVYAVMNMAAFILAGNIEGRSGAVTVKQYRGLGKYLRVEMVCFVIVLMSLTGLPPLAGFMAKFLVFSAAFSEYSSGHSGWFLGLLITGAVTTVVSLFYYFKIPLNAFLRHAEVTPVISGKINVLTLIVMVLSLLLLLWGIFPGLLL